MGVLERKPWIDRIWEMQNDKQAPLDPKVGEQMREMVIRFDTLLSEVLGNYELIWRRWKDKK